MPDTPVIELITQNIVTTLSGITAGANYHHTLTVEREKRRGNKPRHLSCIVFQGDPREDANNPLLLQQWIVPYWLEIYAVIAEDDPTIPSTVLNNTSADIQKALMIDRHRNNLAIDTRILPWNEFLAIDGNHDGRQFNFEVTYRTLETDASRQG